MVISIGRSSSLCILNAKQRNRTRIKNAIKEMIGRLVWLKLHILVLIMCVLYICCVHKLRIV